MKADAFAENRSPLEVIRHMSNLGGSARESKNWSCEMAAVAQQRDRDSFMRIYDHFMPRVCLYIRGLGSSQAIAEELGQESLLRLWLHAAAYDPNRSVVSTWLFRIARNLHIDRMRRERIMPQAEDADIEIMAEAGSDEGVTEDYAEHAHLERRIDALAPVQARLIRMSYFEAKSHQEIASELDMPLGTVKSHLRRAFQRLQVEMGGVA